MMMCEDVVVFTDVGRLVHGPLLECCWDFLVVWLSCL